MEKMRCGAMLAGSVLAALLGGCAGKDPASASDPGGVLTARGEALSATQAYPQPAAQRGSTRYRIIGGVDATAAAVEEVGACDGVEAPPGAVCVSWIVGGARRAARIWDRNADGAIRMPRMINDQREVITEFSPPLVVFPARLEPGAPFTQRVNMRVLAITSGRERERGSATIEMTLLGEQAITIGGRTITAAKVRSVFTADLKNADIVRTTDRWYDAESGLLREHFTETVKILGITGERTSQTFERELE